MRLKSQWRLLLRKVWLCEPCNATLLNGTTWNAMKLAPGHRTFSQHCFKSTAPPLSRNRTHTTHTCTGSSEAKVGRMTPDEGGGQNTHTNFLPTIF